MDFHKILVPVVGAGPEEDTMGLACRLATKGKGKIWSVYVIAIKRALPIDAEIESEILKAETILDHIEEIAEELEFEIDTNVLQAREVGPAIIDEAVERDVNLILMGIEYKRRFGQFSLGNVIPYVLKNAPCPVMLYQK